MRKIQFHPQALRRAERDSIPHRQVRDAACPGEHRSVRHKGAQPQPVQFPADPGLIIRQIDRPLQFPLIQAAVKQGISHAGRHKLKEDLLQLPRIDRAPVCRKSYLQSKGDLSAPIDLTGAARDHLLPGPAHADQAALT